MKKIYKIILICALMLPISLLMFSCGKETPPPPPAQDNTKSNYDMSEAHWDYTQAFVYDGQEKTISVTGLPQGVSVKKYQQASATDAGVYTAQVLEFNYDNDNYNAPSIQGQVWEILKADITGLTLSSKTFEYDSLKHSLQLVGNAPAGSVITYTYNGVSVDGVSEVGSYNVECKVVCKNYKDLTLNATLTIISTEEQLYSAVAGSGIYFQNNLDANKLYRYQGGTLKKVSNDIPKYMIENNGKLYYFSRSLFTEVIKEFDILPSTLYSLGGDYLTTDGTYLYYAVNNLLDKDNGIYKIRIDGSDEAPQKLTSDRAKYLTYLNGYIYYSNASEGQALYRISANGQTTGTLLWDERVSYLTCDENNLYFDSAKIASAIYKYNVSSGEFVKLTTDSGKYLCVSGNYIYYVNNDLLTSSIFGDGIYRANKNLNIENNAPGIKVLSSQDNGFSSLAAQDGNLYYYKRNDKHFYQYDISTETESDLMANFVVQEDDTLSGYSKMAEYNGEIYYTNPNDYSSLYKYNPQTNQNIKVLAESVSSVYFYQDYMYYTAYALTNYATYRLNLNTNEKTKISSSRCENLIFEGNTIYYVKIGIAQTYTNNICKMDLDGQNVETLYNKTNLNITGFAKAGDYIYFSTNPALGYKKLNKLNIATREAEEFKIGTDTVRAENFVIAGNRIYYYEQSEKQLLSCTLDGQDKQTIATSVEIIDLYYTDGTLYYSSSSTANRGLFAYNGGKLSDNMACGMIKLQNQLYYLNSYLTYTNDYPVWKNNCNGKLYKLGSSAPLN